MLIRAQIVGKFTGWTGKTLFRLTNGQFWIQRRHAYLYRYAYRPFVSIEFTNGRWMMKVDGIDESIEVIQVEGFVSQAKGAFKGWIGNTEVELLNGQLWKQVRYLYHYQYDYMPEVVAYQNRGEWEMAVGGSPFVAVQRIH